MTRLSWSNPDPRVEGGVDRGVLYPPTGPGIPWNGLVTVDEKDATEVESLYFDGQKYFDAQVLADYSASIAAFTYPDVLDDLDTFGLSYRTRQGRDIHVVYNVVATPRQVNRASLTRNPSATPFEWDLSTTPAIFDTHRPATHFIIDTDALNSAELASIEQSLYGDAIVDPSLPLPAELQDILDSADFWTVVDHGDGTWSATGPTELLVWLGPDEFQLNQITGDYVDANTYNLHTP